MRKGHGVFSTSGHFNLRGEVYIHDRDVVVPLHVESTSDGTTLRVVPVTVELEDAAQILQHLLLASSSLSSLPQTSSLHQLLHAAVENPSLSLQLSLREFPPRGWCFWLRSVCLLASVLAFPLCSPVISPLLDSLFFC